MLSRVEAWTAPLCAPQHVDDPREELLSSIVGRAFALESRPRLAHPERFLPRLLAAAHAGILLEAQKRGLRESPRTVVVACLVQDGVADLTWTVPGYTPGRFDDTQVAELPFLVTDATSGSLAQKTLVAFSG